MDIDGKIVYIDFEMHLTIAFERRCTSDTNFISLFVLLCFTIGGDLHMIIRSSRGKHFSEEVCWLFHAHNLSFLLSFSLLLLSLASLGTVIFSCITS